MFIYVHPTWEFFGYHCEYILYFSSFSMMSLDVCLILWFPLDLSPNKDWSTHVASLSALILFLWINTYLECLARHDYYIWVDPLACILVLPCSNLTFYDIQLNLSILMVHWWIRYMCYHSDITIYFWFCYGCL